jgi:HAD domain in Swiss Army Knife RNA repair proteins
MQGKPVLLIDVDGVISLFGFAVDARPSGHFETVDGIVHLLSASAGEHLRQLSGHFELVWCTGWEEKANEYLPRALGLPGPLPHLAFDAVPKTRAHWKLDAIDAYAPTNRPLAWIDDAHDSHCIAWAEQRPGPTLLVTTDPAVGLQQDHVNTLIAWAMVEEHQPRPKQS